MPGNTRPSCPAIFLHGRCNIVARYARANEPTDPLGHVITQVIHLLPYASLRKPLRRRTLGANWPQEFRVTFTPRCWRGGVADTCIQPPRSRSGEGETFVAYLEAGGRLASKIKVKLILEKLRFGARSMGERLVPASERENTHAHPSIIISHPLTRMHLLGNLEIIEEGRNLNGDTRGLIIVR